MKAPIRARSRPSAGLRVAVRVDITNGVGARVISTVSITATVRVVTKITSHIGSCST